MATQQQSPFPPPDWTVETVEQLRTVWNDLRLQTTTPGAERTFRGQMLTPEQAGTVFERWILEAFRLSGHVGHYPFRVPLRESGHTREQIDGLVIDGWQGFLLESKFWTGRVDFGPIALLHILVERRPIGTLGLFFSAFGFTEPALESADLLHPIRVLLFDQRDLDWALAREPFKGSMIEMVKRKWLLAVKLGRSRMSVETPIDLFN